MAPNILKGVFREGTMIASVVQEDTSARIMLKGAEPALPRDPAFTEHLTKVTRACWEHIEKFERRELWAVLVQHPTQAEHVEISPDDVRTMGLQRICILDGDCGLTVRVCDDDPIPTPLAYASLRAGAGPVLEQPGKVDIPTTFPRKTYRDLTPPQRQIFEAAAQFAGRGMLRMICVEDEGLKLVVTVKDLPPPRARSVIVPIGAWADEIAKGTSIDIIAKRLQAVRSG